MMGEKTTPLRKHVDAYFLILAESLNWGKHLSRNDAAARLGGFDEVAAAEDIYRPAWEKGNYELCANMYMQFRVLC